MHICYSKEEPKKVYKQKDTTLGIAVYIYNLRVCDTCNQKFSVLDRKFFFDKKDRNYQSLIETLHRNKCFRVNDVYDKM